jgi:hypothetical protein
MALEIDILQCSVGLAALRDASGGVVRLSGSCGLAVPDDSSL